jgi:hypothetical protein
MCTTPVGKPRKTREEPGRGADGNGPVGHGRTRSAGPLCLSRAGADTIVAATARAVASVLSAG